MKRLYFDIEANGLLDTITTVWCLCAKDIDTGETYSFGPDHVKSGIDLLNSADYICGHYICGFDLEALRKVYGWIPDKRIIVRDTLLLSQLAFPDISLNDQAKPYKNQLKDAGCFGSHSLEAWGIRLGNAKGSYGKSESAWDKYTFEMLVYCNQDVNVGTQLLKHLLPNCTEEAIDLEHRFLNISNKMSAHGFRFNIEKAQALQKTIEDDCVPIVEAMKVYCPPKITEMKTPQYYVLTYNGVEYQFDTKSEANRWRVDNKIKPAQCTIKPGPLRVQVEEFNLGSRHQVRNMLFEKFNWVSSGLTDTGQELLEAAEKNNEELDYTELAIKYGAIDEENLKTLDNDVSKLLQRYFINQKTLSQLANGDSAWLNCVNRNTSRIHHRMSTIGCATTRCSHSAPNLGQVPAVSVGTDKQILHGFDGRWGWECRELFEATPGYVMVGVDLSGIEARMLGHYMAKFDNGAYAKQVVSGDIHSMNMHAIKKIAGYTMTRGETKSPFYGWCYGAGDVKLGTLAVEIAKEAKWEFDEKRDFYMRNGSTQFKAAKQAYRMCGRKLRQSFEEGIDGLKELVEFVKTCAKRGYLQPLDGRTLPIRAEHSALNTLLQGTAAIVMKRWVVRTWEEVERRRLRAHLLAVVHDENQAECHEDDARQYADLSIESIKMAGEFYGLALPLDGEAKFGMNWAETH